MKIMNTASFSTTVLFDLKQNCNNIAYMNIFRHSVNCIYCKHINKQTIKQVNPLHLKVGGSGTRFIPWEVFPVNWITASPRLTA